MTELAMPSCVASLLHANRSNEDLAFTLGAEDGEILKVQEIRGYEAVTRIANAPEFIWGVANLRGTIVDMRIKFNLGEPVYNQFTVVIILNVAGRVVGMVEDSVSDVIQLEAEQIRPGGRFRGGVRHPVHHGHRHHRRAHADRRRHRRLMSAEDMALIGEATLQ